MLCLIIAIRYEVQGIHFNEPKCMPFFLPIYDCINNFSLFCSCFSEVNAGSFDAFMSHKISQKRYIIAAVKKTFSKSMAERVRIHNHRIDAVFHCQFFQLPRDATGGNTFPILVQKNEAAFLSLFSQPRKGFILQFFRDINSA